MRGFAVAALEPLSLERGPGIRDMYGLSPSVWCEDGGYSMMLRIVPDEPNPADRFARIHYRRSADGLNFVIDDEPAIAPGPDADDPHGCDDPTVVSGAGGTASGQVAVERPVHSSHRNLSKPGGLADYRPGTRPQCCRAGRGTRHRTGQH